MKSSTPIDTEKSGSAQPQPNILVQVDEYLNSTATVVTLSPHLWLILDRPYLHQATPLHQTEDRCPRCHQALESFALYEPSHGRALRCSCLLMAFADPLTIAKVAPCWASVIQLQSRILARLVPARNN
jgi:hypothetical protein